MGVADGAARWSWGVFLDDGRLRRICREPDGTIDSAPPPDIPNGNDMQVLKDASGQPMSFIGRANGLLVDVIVDHDQGTLGYRINGGPYLEALPPREPEPGMPLGMRESKHTPLYQSASPPTVFRPGAALRPYASLYYPRDSVCFESAFV